MCPLPSVFEGRAVTLTWPSEGVALATMTRAAEMNTLTLDLIGELEQGAGYLRCRKRLRALIITGSGRAFCCGAHLDYFTDPRLPHRQEPVRHPRQLPRQDRRAL